MDLWRSTRAVDGAVRYALADGLLQLLLRELLPGGAVGVSRALVQRAARPGARGPARHRALLLFGLRSLPAAAGRAPAFVFRIAEALHRVVARRSRDALPGGAPRDDAEPRRARRVPEPPCRGELPQPVLRPKILSLVLPVPAGLRPGIARVHGIPAPSLGRRPDCGRRAR